MESLGMEECILGKATASAEIAEVERQEKVWCVQQTKYFRIIRT